MPTTAFAEYSNLALQPVIDPEHARTIDVLIGVSLTIAKGTILGRVTTGGRYIPYLTGASDGSQTAAVIAQYDMVTDASGNVTIQGGAPAGTYKAAPVYWRGVFKISELVGLDAAGVQDMNGRLLLTNDPDPATSTGYLVLP